MHTVMYITQRYILHWCWFSVLFLLLPFFFYFSVFSPMLYSPSLLVYLFAENCLLSIFEQTKQMQTVLNARTLILILILILFSPILFFFVLLSFFVLLTSLLLLLLLLLGGRCCVCSHIIVFSVLDFVNLFRRFF